MGVIVLVWLIYSQASIDHAIVTATPVSLTDQGVTLTYLSHCVEHNQIEVYWPCLALFPKRLKDLL